MNEEQKTLILALVDEAEKWADANDLSADTDTNMNCILDGYEFIVEMIKIKKGIK